MPQGDRTGPLGLGPGTGNAFDYCYGYDSPGYTRGMGRESGRGSGRGMGRGRGFGRGLGYGDYNRGTIPGWMPAFSKEDEIKLLKSRAEALSRSQKSIEKRLADLEKEETPASSV